MKLIDRSDMKPSFSFSGHEVFDSVTRNNYYEIGLVMYYRKGTVVGFPFTVYWSVKDTLCDMYDLRWRQRL